MSDIFLTISISEKSRKYATFSWKGIQYQFKRLPQGYLTSPVIAHTLLTSQIGTSRFQSLIISYIEDIMMYNDNYYKQKRLS